MASSAVFVDRDNTLMFDVGYCGDPEQVQLMPRVTDGLRLLNDGGLTIVVVTNQSGVGRGYFSPSQLEAVNDRLRHKLRVSGADFHAIYCCPHRPDEECSCRKPKPGLLLRAASDLRLDLGSSYMVGDKEMDILAGKAAGTQTIRLLGRSTIEDLDTVTCANLVATDLLEAAKLILSRKGRSTNDIPYKHY